MNLRILQFIILSCFVTKSYSTNFPNETEDISLKSTLKTTQQDHPNIEYIIVPSRPYLPEKQYQDPKPLDILKDVNTFLSNQEYDKYFNSLAYVINSPKTLHVFRDQSLITYAKKFLLPTLIQLSNKNEAAIRSSLLKALKLLASRETSQNSNRVESLILLGNYYNPLENPYYKVQKKSAEYYAQTAKGYYQQGLDISASIPEKFIFSKALSLLYENDFLPNEKQSYNLAANYYIDIMNSKQCPLKIQIQSRLHLSRLLHNNYNPLILKTRDDIVTFLMENVSCSSEYYLEVLLEHTLTKSQLCAINLSKENYDFFAQSLDKVKLVMSRGGISKSLYEKTVITYFSSIIPLLHKNSPSDEGYGYWMNELERIVFEVKDLPKIWFQQAVSTLAHIKDITGQINLGSKSRNKMLINFLEIGSQNAQGWPLRNLCEFLKIIFKFEENIFPKEKNKNSFIEQKRQNLKELLQLIDNRVFTFDMKVRSIRAMSFHTLDLYPTYNNDIGKLITYLKKELRNPEFKIYRYQLQHFLYLYYKAYKKVSITAEEALEYVTALTEPNVPEYYKLSGEDVPKNLRIQFLDSALPADISSSRIAGDKVLNTPTLVQQETLDMGPVKLEEEFSSSKIAEDTVFETPILVQQKAIDEDPKLETTSPLKASPLSISPIEETVSEPTIALKPSLAPSQYGSKISTSARVPKDRIIKKYEEFIERLEADRGNKVTYQEVSNMLRRLNYKIKPTQDRTLTIHRPHKNQNTYLSKAQKRDIADFLKTAPPEKVQGVDNLF